MSRIAPPLLFALAVLANPALIADTLADTMAGNRAVTDTAALVREYRQAHEQEIVDEFAELLRIPNVASDLPNIRRNAEHIRQLLTTRGITARLLEVDGLDAPPAVYGERLVPGADLTIMVYVHYDGQPVQADNWASDPWTPVMRDALVEAGGKEVPMQAPFDPEWRVFARSAGDDKAPIVALLHALDALDRLGMEPAVNLKLFFEGEEEAGSPNLRALLQQHRDLLAADLWLFCDGPMHQTRRLQLAYGVRGSIGFDMTVYGPGRPLHSGHYGNWAPNPVAMLTALMSSMRSGDGEVLIDGFYDQVNEPTPAELEAISRIPRVDLALRQQLALGRTEGKDRLELQIMRPALNFRGVQAGGVGSQARNIILPEARASVGIRMVPGQTIDVLKQTVESHIRAQGYHIVREEPDDATRAAHPRVVRVDWGNNGYPAYRTPLDHSLATALVKVLQPLADGELIQSPTMGGSLPLYLIEEVVGAPVIILPIANHDNNQHGKDENLRLANLWAAIEIYAAVLGHLGQ